MFGHEFDLGFGGKGANQAVAARLCGARPRWWRGSARISSARRRSRISTALGIDASEVRVLDGVSSGVAPIFVDPSGQNRIIVVKGANDRLMPADVDRAAPLLERAGCLVLQFEIPLETVAYAVRFARSRGIRTIVNPAPALPIDLDVLTDADYFIPNETEAEALTGHAGPDGAPGRAVRDGARRARLPSVILTLGDQGRALRGRGRGDARARARGRDEGHDRRRRRLHRELRDVPRSRASTKRGRRAREPLCRAFRPRRRHPEVVLARADFEREWSRRGRR